MILWIFGILADSALPNVLFWKFSLCCFVKVDLFYGFGNFGQPWRLNFLRFVAILLCGNVG